MEWKMTTEKKKIIERMERESEEEKKRLPVLLSKYDLRKRWDRKIDRVYITIQEEKIFLNQLMSLLMDKLQFF